MSDHLQAALLRAAKRLRVDADKFDKLFVARRIRWQSMHRWAALMAVEEQSRRLRLEIRDEINQAAEDDHAHSAARFSEIQQLLEQYAQDRDVSDATAATLVEIQAAIAGTSADSWRWAATQLVALAAEASLVFY